MAIVASASTFTGNSPEFSLRADTRGGPPEEYFWTRNGEPISDDDSFDIALDVPADIFGSQPRSALPVAQYNSTLVVRGDLPGEYGYTVNNRPTPMMVMSSFDIEGMLAVYILLKIAVCLALPGLCSVNQK